LEPRKIPSRQIRQSIKKLLLDNFPVDTQGNGNESDVSLVSPNKKNRELQKVVSPKRKKNFTPQLEEKKEEQKN